MAYRSMPFGYSRGHIVQAPAPQTGMTKANTGYNEVTEFGNGGASVTDSAGKHAVFNMGFSGDAADLAGLEIFSEFAAGLWGKGPIHFSDPMNYDLNLMPPHWAAPHLSELGWKNPVLGTPTYLAFTPNAFVPYYRQTSNLITVAANNVPTHGSKVATLLIPPTHKLWLGFKGTKTGTAQIVVQPINLDGTLAATQNITLLAATTNVQLNTSFDGATYRAVEIYTTRTSDLPADVSTLILNASTAQLWPRAVAPVLTGRHVPGKGHTGVRFGDAAISESYVMTRGHRKQLSTTLVEVGAWL